MKPGRIIHYLQGNRFVYCAKDWSRVAAAITLRIPITSPPITAENFQPKWMEGKQLLIFKLHGYENQPDWYGMDEYGHRFLALTPALVKCADLEGAIVIALVCYGAYSEMSKAFFEAGVAAFFGSKFEMRGRDRDVGEADRLVKLLLHTLPWHRHDLISALGSAMELYHRANVPMTEHDWYTMKTFTLWERST